MFLQTYNNELRLSFGNVKEIRSLKTIEMMSRRNAQLDNKRPAIIYSKSTRETFKSYGSARLPKVRLITLVIFSSTSVLVRRGGGVGNLNSKIKSLQRVKPS